MMDFTFEHLGMLGGGAGEEALNLLMLMLWEVLGNKLTITRELFNTAGILLYCSESSAACKSSEVE